MNKAANNWVQTASSGTRHLDEDLVPCLCITGTLLVMASSMNESEVDPT